MSKDSTAYVCRCGLIHLCAEASFCCHVANKLRLITWTDSLQYSEQDAAPGTTWETDTSTDSVHSCSSTSGHFEEK